MRFKLVTATTLMLLVFALVSIGCGSTSVEAQEETRPEVTPEMMEDACRWIEQQTEFPLIMAQAKAKWGEDCYMVREEYETQVATWEDVGFFGCGGC